MTRFLLAVAPWLALTTGCELNVNGIPVATTGEAGIEMPPNDAQAPADAQASADAQAPADATPPTDAMTEQAGQDAGAPEPLLAGLRHPGCEDPIPDEVPDNPSGVMSDPFGRSRSDEAWRLISCAEATFPTCSEYDGTDGIFCTLCVGAADLNDGICASRGGDWPFCVPLHDLATDCWACVRPEAKARACCAGLDVDCHAVSDGPSALGQICRRHLDCETGLLCVAPEQLPWSTREISMAVCTCPGAVPNLTACVRERVEPRL